MMNDCLLDNKGKLAQLPQLVAGLSFTAIFVLLSFLLARQPPFASLAISPLVIAVLSAMVFSAVTANKYQLKFSLGIVFAAKKLLRLGIILYGFRITLTDLAAAGWRVVLLAVIVVAATAIFGTVLGRKLFKLDGETSLLIASGCAVCGAAAILAIEPVVAAKPHQSSMAVAVIVVFGVLAMLLYPLAYRLGLLPFDQNQMGLYIGATIHEVAHVVGAGSAISATVANNAVLVKMIRVLLLVPYLLVLSVFYPNGRATKRTTVGVPRRFTITIPWFALLFMVAIVVNSVIPLTADQLNAIKQFDTFLLTMAMAALGLQTDFKKFSAPGVGGFALGLVLTVMLALAGILLTIIFS